MAATTIQPDRLLRELSELWVTFGKEQGDKSTGVLRACAMTLVVVDDAAQNAADAGETLANLMHDHPSRAIVVRVVDSDQPELDARVFAQCWMPQGQRRQICCEQIEITSSNVSMSDLPAVMLPLVVADLPVILWSRVPRLFGGPALNQLSRLATKTVADSAAFPDALAALRQFARTVSEGVVIGDLAWTRLTRWREQLAQIFDNPSYASEIAKVAAVTVAHPGDAPPVGARYMAAWIRVGLQGLGVKPQIRFENASGASDAGITRIELSGGGLRVAVRKLEGTCAEVTVNDLTTRTVFHETSDYALLREELSISGRDPIFESALAMAAQG